MLKHEKTLIFTVNQILRIGGTERFIAEYTRLLAPHYNIIIMTNHGGKNSIFDNIDFILLPTNEKFQEILELSEKLNNKKTTFISFGHLSIDLKVKHLFCNAKHIIQWRSGVNQDYLYQGNNRTFDHLNGLFELQIYDRIDVLSETQANYIKKRYNREAFGFYSHYMMEEHKISDYSGGIAWVGNYRYEKGVEDLINIINAYDGNLHFHIYGKWSDEEINNFKKQITKNNYTLHGFVIDNDQKFGDKKVFLMTSRSEGWPRVVTEAQTYGIPAIVPSRLDNAIELTHKNYAGQVVDIENTVEVIEAINNLENDELMRKQCLAWANSLKMSFPKSDIVKYYENVPISVRANFKNIIFYVNQYITQEHIEDKYQSLIKDYNVSYLIDGQFNFNYFKNIQSHDTILIVHELTNFEIYNNYFLKCKIYFHLNKYEDNIGNLYNYNAISYKENDVKITNLAQVPNSEITYEKLKMLKVQVNMYNFSAATIVKED